MYKAVLFALAVLLLLPNFFNKDINASLAFNHQLEKFNHQLSDINNLSKLEFHFDSLAKSQQISKRSFAYVELLESILTSRFYHGFSHYSLSENWIAAITGKLIKEDYACKVDEEKILQHDNAACSQQTIVMMALLRKKNITYRNVGFPHHYAMEVLVNNNWYFFDADMEPAITENERLLSSWNHQNDLLKKYYDTKQNSNLDYQFGVGQTASTGTINEIPAINARIFFAITGFLSKTLWFFPILLILLQSKQVSRTNFFIQFSRKKTDLSWSV